MKKWSPLNLLVALLLLPSAALALSQSSIPPKFPLVWGSSAGSAYIRSIPQNSQIGITNCAASLTDGFPPLTFVPAAAGGCPPFGADFNGILRQLSQWNQWQSAGGPVFYDSGFASSIGGYPKAAILMSSVTPGTLWMSTADNNTTNPDTGGSNWVQAPGQVPIGTPVQTLSTTVQSGYVSANAKTIGNGSSNATNRANADTFFLFVYVWNNCPNAQCPIYTSSGSASTRGGSCTYATCADYAANKAIAVWNMNGTALMGADSQNGSTSTLLASVPITSGNSTTPGSILGENLHTLTVGELATHSHANILFDPGHTHGNTLFDPGHTHSNTLTDPGHGHTVTVTDPGHSHGITDPGHAHTGIPTTNSAEMASFNATLTAGSNPVLVYNTGTSLTNFSTSSSHTGVTVNTATTGITAAANSNTTGITINNAAALTGLTITNAAALTGITITNANAGSNTPHNTVARSILVYWNLKL